MSTIAMSSFSEVLNSLFRGVLRLVLVVASGIFVLSFLAAALIVVVAVSLWSLLAGKKPAPVMMFEQFKARSQRFGQGQWGQGGAANGRDPASGQNADVVDVEVIEVEESAVRKDRETPLR
ncbi:hypothetical protein [Hydrogenophaga sp. 5NK40-0174]|uniref:hypothetical protein n=1 Tax=Hydrogenophaga sp. 5NK40-0174 TaxID=3127649 RepID=UPI00310C7BA9